MDVQSDQWPHEVSKTSHYHELKYDYIHSYRHDLPLSKVFMVNIGSISHQTHLIESAVAAFFFLYPLFRQFTQYFVQLHCQMKTNLICHKFYQQDSGTAFLHIPVILKFFQSILVKTQMFSKNIFNLEISCSLPSGSVWYKF